MLGRLVTVGLMCSVDGIAVVSQITLLTTAL